MRDALRQVIMPDVPDHPGLAYDVWAPIANGTGKVSDGEVGDWLERICKTRVPDGYGEAYESWRNGLAESQVRLVEMTLNSRLLIGHGNPSATDVGLTLHRTWGVPVIPGSSLKGLLAHYLETVHGPETKGHPLDPDLSEEQRERAKYQGVVFHEKSGRPKHGPGEVYRFIFGAPDTDVGLHVPGAEALAAASKGRIIFHDALMIPKGPKRFLEADVLTVHQKEYYQGAGKSLPNDYDDPNPVSFMTVAPGTRFLLAIDGPDDWTALVMSLLERALGEWGVGGKTSSGYGRGGSFEAREQARSSCFEEFRSFVAKSKPAEQFDRLESEWLPKLLGLSREERDKAADLVAKLKTANKKPRLDMQKRVLETLQGD